MVNGGRERGDGTHEVAVSNDNEVQVPIVTNCDRFAHSDLVPLVGSLHLFAFIVRASGPFLASLLPLPRFCEHARALFRTEMTSFCNVIVLYTRCQRRNWNSLKKKARAELSYDLSK